MVRQRTTFTVPLHILKGFVIIVKLIEKIAKNRSFFGVGKEFLNHFGTDRALKNCLNQANSNARCVPKWLRACRIYAFIFQASFTRSSLQLFDVTLDFKFRSQLIELL